MLTSDARTRRPRFSIAACRANGKSKAAAGGRGAESGHFSRGIGAALRQSPARTSWPHGRRGQTRQRVSSTFLSPHARPWMAIKASRLLTSQRHLGKCPGVGDITVGIVQCPVCLFSSARRGRGDDEQSSPSAARRACEKEFLVVGSKISGVLGEIIGRADSNAEPRRSRPDQWRRSFSVMVSAAVCIKPGSCHSAIMKAAGHVPSTDRKYGFVAANMGRLNMAGRVKTITALPSP